MIGKYMDTLVEVAMVIKTINQCLLEEGGEELRFEVGGHTSENTQGPGSAVQLNLSQKRAEAVVDVLEKEGVKESLLSATPFSVT